MIFFIFCRMTPAAPVRFSHLPFYQSFGYMNGAGLRRPSGVVPGEERPRDLRMRLSNNHVGNVVRHHIYGCLRIDNDIEGIGAMCGFLLWEVLVCLRRFVFFYFACTYFHRC